LRRSPASAERPPRGFPYAARNNVVSAPGEPAAENRARVLFHCDGVEAVTELMARYRGWLIRLHESYGPQEIPSLDLWVQQERGMRSWDFEGFEDDVVRIARRGAEQRLASLSSGPLNEWVGRLGFILDRYFSALETPSSASEI
jgi:hypothetical protein